MPRHSPAMGSIGMSNMEFTFVTIQMVEELCDCAFKAYQLLRPQFANVADVECIIALARRHFNVLASRKDHVIAIINLQLGISFL